MTAILWNSFLKLSIRPAKALFELKKQVKKRFCAHFSRPIVQYNYLTKLNVCVLHFSVGFKLDNWNRKVPCNVIAIV